MASCGILRAGALWATASLVVPVPLIGRDSEGPLTMPTDRDGSARLGSTAHPDVLDASTASQAPSDRMAVVRPVTWSDRRMISPCWIANGGPADRG